MAYIPAVCNTCGTVFENREIDIRGAGRHTFTGSMIGFCPNCGGMGSIVDGTYQVVGDAIRIIATAGSSRKQVEQLRRILLQAQADRPQPQDVAQRIQSETPDLSGLAGFFEKFIVPKNAGEFWAIIGALLAALAIIIPLLGPDSKPDNSPFSEEQVERIVEKAVASAIRQTQSIPSAAKLQPVGKKKKTGRNELCPCQSGKKYKMCCLDREKSVPR